MSRYPRDPRLREFHAKIKLEIKRISDLAKGRRFVIYAIRDPSQTDHRRSHPDGPPMYVGLSKQLHIRADDHMKDGGRGTNGGRLKAGHLHRIMKKFIVPKFQILDEAPTLLTAHIAETVWARRYCWLGYELANGWPEHQSKDTPKGIESLPLKRLWEFTVLEAIEDGVTLVLECAQCDVSQNVDLETLNPAVKLNLIGKLQLTCTCCGKQQRLRPLRPSPESGRWASYTPRTMTADC